MVRSVDSRVIMPPTLSPREVDPGNPAQGQGRSLLAMLPQSAPQSSPRNSGTLRPLDLSASPSVQSFSIMALPARSRGPKDLGRRGRWCINGISRRRKITESVLAYLPSGSAVPGRPGPPKKSTTNEDCTSPRIKLGEGAAKARIKTPRARRRSTRRRN